MNPSISYSNIRANLKTFFDQVCKDRLPLLVKRRIGGNVVVISEEDFRSMEETFYLMKSPRNAKHLLESLDQAKNGESVKLDLKKLQKEIDSK